MKVKVPKRIKIGINTYSVSFLADEVLNDNEFGACWHRKQYITVDPSSHPTQRYTTFLHELIHLIEKSYVFRIEDDNVDRIAQGMGEFMRDNLGIEFDWGDIK